MSKKHHKKCLRAKRATNSTRTLILKKLGSWSEEIFVPKTIISSSQKKVLHLNYQQHYCASHATTTVYKHQYLRHNRIWMFVFLELWSFYGIDPDALERETNNKRGGGREFFFLAVKGYQDETTIEKNRKVCFSEDFYWVYHQNGLLCPIWATK